MSNKLGNLFFYWHILKISFSQKMVGKVLNVGNDIHQAGHALGAGQWLGLGAGQWLGLGAGQWLGLGVRAVARVRGRAVASVRVGVRGQGSG